MKNIDKQIYVQLPIQTGARLEYHNETAVTIPLHFLSGNQNLKRINYIKGI